jgi:hypothetical protein
MADGTLSIKPMSNTQTEPGFELPLILHSLPKPCPRAFSRMASSRSPTPLHRASKHDPATDALLEKRTRRSIQRRRTRSCSRSTVVDEALFLFVTHDVNPRAKSRGALRSRQRKEPYVIALPCRRWLCISLAPNLLSIPSPMVSPPGWRQNCFTTVQFSRNMDYIIKTS